MSIFVKAKTDINKKTNSSMSIEYEHLSNPHQNLFDLIPTDWVSDQSLIKDASMIFSTLAKAHRQLFNSVILEGDRLKRFCQGPSSLNHHHSFENGNLKHTIEVCKNIKRLCEIDRKANYDLVMAAGLLHDLGKADEYAQDRKEMTLRGSLIGHKITIIEWVAVAYKKHNLVLPENHYESLIHLLSSCVGPDWVGLRKPMMRECLILSSADRFSSSDDVMNKYIPNKGGLSQFHKQSGTKFFGLEHA